MGKLVIQDTGSIENKLWRDSVESSKGSIINNGVYMGTALGLIIELIHQYTGIDRETICNYALVGYSISYWSYVSGQVASCYLLGNNEPLLLESDSE